jgi:hypothetical protein
LVASAALDAFTITDIAEATDAGAAYSPLVETVPTLLLPPATPLTDHVTPVFVVPVTVAVNCCAFPAASVTEEGESVTLTGGFKVPVEGAVLWATIVSAVVDVIPAGAAQTELKLWVLETLF